MARAIRAVRLFIVIFIIFSFMTEAYAGVYKYDLEAIKKRCQQQIELIRKKIKEVKRRQAQDEKAGEIEEVFNQAEGLYQQGKLEKAQELYEKTYKLANDSFMQDYAGFIKQEEADAWENDADKRLEVMQITLERLEVMQITLDRLELEQEALDRLCRPEAGAVFSQ